MRFFFAIGSLALLGPTIDAARAADADVGQVLSRVEEAHGGDAVRDVQGFRARGRFLDAAGVSGRLEVVVDLDAAAYRANIRYLDRTEIRILSGPIAWAGGPRRQEVADEALRESILREFHLFTALFALLDVPPDSLRVDGESPEGFVRLAPISAGASSLVWEVDPETGLVRGVQEGEHVAAAHDFREVEGVPFPYRHTRSAGGEMEGEIVLERVVLETEFGPHEFLPAGSAPGM